MNQLHKWGRTVHLKTERMGTESIQQRLMAFIKRRRSLTFILLPMLFSASAMAQTIAGTTSVCVGHTTALSYTTTGGSWSSSNTGVAAVDNGTGAVTGVAAGTATISYTVSSITATTVLTVNALPDAGTISGATDVCVLNHDTLTSSGTGGVWSADNAIVSVGATSGIVTGNALGSVAIKYTVTNSCGSSVASANITVNGFIGDIYTFAGTGALGFSGDGGPAYLAQVGNPRDLFVDTTTGSVYYCDQHSNTIRKITRSGIITTVAGNGTAGDSGDGLQATAATLNAANGVFVDHAGNIFISNTSSHTVRKVSPSGIISTIAGTSGVTGTTGDGLAATAATLNFPLGILEDAAGDIYVASQSANNIRKITTSTGKISTVAGSPAGAQGFGGDGGPATAALLKNVRGLTMDNSGNIYIADAGNNRIRKFVPSTGIITTFAGTGDATHTGDGGPATAATITTPARFAYDGANILYLSDQANNVIREINLATGIITEVAGIYSTTGGYSGDYASAVSAQLNTPAGIAVDHFGHFYIADALNNRIRVVPSTGSLSASILGPTTVCTGTPVSFSAFLSSSGSPSYQWQRNGINVGSGPTYTNTSPANGAVYRCIVTVTPGCSAPFNDTSNNITVTVQSPAAIVLGSTTIYAGQSTTLSDPTSGGTWTSSATSVATIDGSGILYGVAPGTATISYQVTNVCGTSVANVTVTINPTDIITASAGPHGSMSPTGSVSVPGGSETFTMFPDAGYHVADILVDGVSKGDSGSYTFTSITGPHTISVTFAPDCATPVITVCPGNVTVSSDAGSCGAVVTYTGATVTGSSVTTTYSQNLGSFFPVGTTTVTVNATN